MDRIVDKIAALGIPGLVLLLAMGIVGWSGAAAITAALALLGGPLGMLGGIGVLILLALVGKSITKYGFETVLKSTIGKLKEKGHSKEEAKQSINNYAFVSNDLKRKMCNHIDKEWI